MAKVNLSALLKALVEQGASDLHITVGTSPQFRIEGKMVKVKSEPLTGADTKELCYSILTETQKARFERAQEIDFSFGIKNLSRFRANLFYQRGDVGAVFRRVPFEIPSFSKLALPDVLKAMINIPNGLILVTGPTGSGKSTTIASLLDILNESEFGHIMTVEDPIEFVHNHKNCIVNQREVGVDTPTFGSALKRILRQDPDYILIGEMRDLETVEMALTLAETGHLVFGTLHTNNAIQSINRIINIFPPHQHSQVRQVLSFTLNGIVSQQLIRSEVSKKMNMAMEILIPNLAIRNLIREDKLHQVYSMMQTGQSESGMRTMNQTLIRLVKEGKISPEEAMVHSFVPEELNKLLSTIKR